MELGHWSLLDHSIVLGSLVLSFLTGLWFRGKPAVGDYFFGEKTIPIGLLLVSLVAADTGGLVFLTLPGWSWKPGGSLVFLQLACGFVIGRLIVAGWILPWYFRANYLSAYQLLGQRLRLPIEQIASGLFLFMHTVADGLKLYLAAMLVSDLIPLKPGWCILIAGLFTLSYTALGGIRAVLWTTLVQYLLFTGAAIAIFALILGQLPGGWSQLIEVGSEAGKLQTVQTWADAKGLRGLAGLQAWFLDPAWLFAGLLGGAFWSMASHGCDQVIVQRYLCTSSKGAAQTALIGGAFVAVLQCALYLAIGIGIYCLQVGGTWTPLGEVAPDRAFGRFVADQSIPGLSGFMVAAVLAAVVCSLSTSWNGMASAILGDFVRAWYPQLRGELEVAVSRWSVFVCGFLQMAIAWIAWGAIDDQAAIATILEVTAYLAGPILGLFLLATMREPVRSTAAIGGALLGATVVGFLWLPTLWDKPYLAYPWYVPLGALATWGLGVVLEMPGKKKRLVRR